MKNKGFFSGRRARRPAPVKVNCAESLLLQKRRPKPVIAAKPEATPFPPGRSSTQRLLVRAACGPGGRSGCGCRRAGGPAPQASPGPPPGGPEALTQPRCGTEGVARAPWQGQASDLGQPHPRSGQKPRGRAPAAGRAASDTSGGARPVRGPNRNAGRLRLGQQCGHGRLIRPQILPSPSQATLGGARQRD